jgi:2-methylisocitrate lyase-like PEP mutase family enzyme
MPTQSEKAIAFRALHEGASFVIPNAWDAGSACVLEGLGFVALATTSSGFAFTLGRRDGGAGLNEVADHASALDDATELPVSVDLENGYGPDPDDAARAIERIAEAGAVGGSIEDYDPAGHLYERSHAVERIAAAVGAARALPFPFTLTARAENHIRGNPDLEDTIERLLAFERAGRTSSTRPVCRPSRRFGRYARRSRGRSTSWRFRCSARLRRSPRPARSGSASAGSSRGSPYRRSSTPRRRSARRVTSTC